MANFTGSIADAGRLLHLAKRRERQKEDIEKQKQKLKDDASSLTNFEGKFKAHYDAIENTLKSNTVGLVTLDEMRARQEDYVKRRELQLAHKRIEDELRQKNEEELEAEKTKKREEQQKRRVLSFDPDDEEEDSREEQSPTSSSKKTIGAEAVDSAELEESSERPTSSKKGQPVFKKKKIGKDPTVDTSFLPDKEREEEENRLREELRFEWAMKQEEIKNEEINIAFSYWDGSGHRRDTKMKKGHTIGQFLQKALEILRKDFNELKVASSDSLMFVKEDLIIPHFYTFYDFIVAKAMGKTGPLFAFDAAGELRVRQDAVLDIAESHPAKVMLRSWYEKNKHIYPSSRWEPFAPNKKYERTYEDLSTL